MRKENVFEYYEENIQENKHVEKTISEQLLFQSDKNWPRLFTILQDRQLNLLI